MFEGNTDVTRLTRKITGIEIRNFMRIRTLSLEIDPTKGLITIGGENAQGKSSALIAIEAALDSIPKMLKSPQHEGATGPAAIRIKVPPYEVRRWWNEEDGKPGLKVVRIDDGSTIDNAKDFLKDLLGEGFINPAEFMNAQPIEQRKILMELVGLDLTKVDADIELAKQAKKVLEDKQIRLQHQTEELPWHEDVPEEEQSIGTLTASLQDGIKSNNANAQRRLEAKASVDDVSRAQGAAEQQSVKVEELRQLLAQAENRLAELQAEVNTKEQIATEMAAMAEALEDVDLAPLQEAIGNVEATNRKVRENQARLKARQSWKDAETELGEQIDALKALEDSKKLMLSEAQFPIAGLGFDAKQATLNGQPFGQASHAEQIRVSVAISVAKRGMMAPILIPDASTLDAKTLLLMTEEAEKYGAQVFAEIVANRKEDGSYDRECAFYIEDGALAPVPVGVG